MPTVDEVVREQTDETCQLCASERREAGLEPMFMLRLAPTLYHELEVLACPDCDGIEVNGSK